MSNNDGPRFLKAFAIGRNDVVALIGAGGKTSLMFRLAAEARAMGLKVLVTTSTRILVPEPYNYDAIDLSGRLFLDKPPVEPGIYVGGLPDSVAKKMVGVREDLLSYQQKQFDLLLIEADGSAQKPLKGWKSDEPVIPANTTKTIGVLDIQTIGRPIGESIIHRLELFTAMTGGQPGETVGIGHLVRVIIHNEGLFGKAFGREILFINKVESVDDCRNTALLRAQLENIAIIAGSVQQGTIHG